MNRPPPDAAKALLLCAHAEELSAQSAAALRRGVLDGPPDLQSRKHTVIAEVAALVKEPALQELPELQQAVARLRAALQAEMRLLTAASGDVQNELLTVGAAQRRLAQARHYDTATQAQPDPGGSQFSTCG